MSGDTISMLVGTFTMLRNTLAMLGDTFTMLGNTFTMVMQHKQVPHKYQLLPDRDTL
ncbi:hypothetical protein NCWK1_4601 [Nostoc cycadae WK-1]|uniref:Uncharacterized protein n=1 Tax=Nostoc cycadae WK-1 TaxID=1861711 RepID=A0A2H6LNL5_9NOSO|nr:hypothetical protein NCWK1_4601 [Nostoc cycadae WK-1]